jgi:hypothetical protein
LLQHPRFAAPEKRQASNEKAALPRAVSLWQGSETEQRLAFANTERMRQRIGIFLALPFKSLDRLALKNRLAAIGRGNTD